LFLKKSNKKVITIVDDDYKAITQDNNLPLRYRLKTLRNYLTNFKELKRLTDKWVVTNAQLQKLYPGAQIIDPYWGMKPSPEVNENLQIAFLGTRSHLKDLMEIAPPLVSFLTRAPNTQFRIFLGEYSPKELSSLANVENVNPLGWKEYLTLLTQKRIDLSLLPSKKTSVNLARSTNKLFEAVFAGGICAFSDNYAHKDYAKEYQLGLNYDSIGLDQLLEKCHSNLPWLQEKKMTAHNNALLLKPQIKEKQKRVLLEKV